ncbi:MAG: IrrE N-terminal-like domain [Acidimicrobiaceae bacterium]|jgi:Zn-dependent peptidase ImmA (M78 family)|nr:IrrE N-terminal-like domain [Acidimicrobiaceae bacterium]
MNSTHLSAPAEIAADLRRRADERQPSFSTAAIIATCFPKLTVTGHSTTTVPLGMLMRAMGHVIIYQRELPIPEQRVRIAHHLAHVIFDGHGRIAACTYAPDAEMRADQFAAELLVPLDELKPFVWRLPPDENTKDVIYWNQCDLIASRFAVPARLIDKRIRELRAS